MVPVLWKSLLIKFLQYVTPCLISFSIFCLKTTTLGRCVWLPFMKDNLAVDERTIIIGHSSGACAAVRSVFLTTLVLFAAFRSVSLTGMGVCSWQSVSLNAVELVKLSGLSFSWQHYFCSSEVSVSHRDAFAAVRSAFFTSAILLLLSGQ
jgi:hypothetical protein